METFSPRGEHTHTVIFLHGRDSTAKEFAEEFFESQASGEETLLDFFPSVKWVFPSAGLLNSARFGCELSQWFDMHNTENPHEQEDDQHLLPSMKRIQDIIAQEAALIGHDKIILGGISQGCAVAIYALLSGHRQLGGFIGLCSWLPKREVIKRIDRTTNQAIKTPLLLCHSQDDDVINVTFGIESRDSLESIGMKPRWCEYAPGAEMPHWVNEPQGVDDMVAFLGDVGVPAKRNPLR
ncbi:unnamed protein product [Zymoseptoria tritici ST99CH_1A5]|uniref:Phospholipase/carboxylesterase/thioesterase domain-containing protein n=1 Tax=Zymoseptoria tritici ST99CH_1A5 TaxID=1276529 RepID=A0A1Y6LAB2_ZYMTR|nr:unnamed protein product [Zymoseptoria tritici ST99CH_1A5]